MTKEVVGTFFLGAPEFVLTDQYDKVISQRLNDLQLKVVEFWFSVMPLDQFVKIKLLKW
jgi:hypothetical protein